MSSMVGLVDLFKTVGQTCGQDPVGRTRARWCGLILSRGLVSWPVLLHRRQRKKRLLKFRPTGFKHLQARHPLSRPSPVALKLQTAWRMHRGLRVSEIHRLVCCTRLCRNNKRLSVVSCAYDTGGVSGATQNPPSAQRRAWYEGERVGRTWVYNRTDPVPLFSAAGERS